MSARELSHGLTRRALLGYVGVPIALSTHRGAPPEPRQSRTEAAYRVRITAAQRHRSLVPSAQRTNGDEHRYANNVAHFSKGLAHDWRGEMMPAAYQAFVAAVTRGQARAIERLLLGNVARLVNPLAAFSYVLEGSDPQQLAIDPPPVFHSEATAAEMVELYWQALVRDVPFADYATDAATAAAAQELERWGVLPSGRSADLFRASIPGATIGPYVSQFLWQDVPQGAVVVRQRIRVAIPGVDYLFTPARWLAVQNGEVAGRNQFDEIPRYIRSGRDLASYVHHDFSFQAFLNASLILLSRRNATHPANPYHYLRAQDAFCTFGEPHVLDLVARVANAALKATWYQKWVVHRRLRPEEFGGRVQRVRENHADYPVYPRLLHARAIDEVARRCGGASLLTQAYPEGAPAHPAFPAGHAAIAGACATVMKAFFDESLPVRDPVVPDDAGVALRPYDGPQLTVGGELNKLALNISMARNFAGIHWRTDCVAGLRLGEATALEILADMKGCFREHVDGVTLTTFDGQRVTV